MKKTATRHHRISRRRAAKAQRRHRRQTSFRGPLPRPEVRADDPTLTAHAGLLPVITYMADQLGLVTRLRGIIGRGGRKRVHPVHHVLFAFIVAALAGVERLAHLECLRGDLLLAKVLRLAHWPVRKVFSHALGSLSDHQRDALAALVAEQGLATLPPDTKSLIIDIDPTAIVSYGEAEDALFGYCGKGRRRRRHFPLVASVAETRAIVHVKYRDGSGITADEMIEFIQGAVDRVRGRLGTGCRITVRGDAGLWSGKIGRWLQQQGLPFVMAMPLVVGVKLHARVATFSPVNEDPDIEATLLEGKLVGAGEDFRVAVIRRRVHDRKAPPQGKKIEGEPGWRYQAVVSDRPWAPDDLWRFYNGRADCENVFRVGKQALALGKLVGRSYRANEIAFLLRSLAYNADLHFQAHCERRAREENRKVLRVGLEWRQPRFYRSPGRLLRHRGRWILRVPEQPVLAHLWAFFAPDLVAAPAAAQEAAAA